MNLGTEIETGKGPLEIHEGPYVLLVSKRNEKTNLILNFSSLREMLAFANNNIGEFNFERLFRISDNNGPKELFRSYGRCPLQFHNLHTPFLTFRLKFLSLLTKSKGRGKREWYRKEKL